MDDNNYYNYIIHKKYNYIMNFWYNYDKHSTFIVYTTND